jgi:hypothetical protein
MIAGDIRNRDEAKMAKKLPPRRRTTSTAGPFFDLLDQMEALTITVELDWPDNIRADAQRRSQPACAGLYGTPQKPVRGSTFDRQAAASPAVVSVSISSTTISQPWLTACTGRLKSGIFQ